MNCNTPCSLCTGVLPLLSPLLLLLLVERVVLLQVLVSTLQLFNMALHIIGHRLKHLLGGLILRRTGKHQIAALGRFGRGYRLLHVLLYCQFLHSKAIDLADRTLVSRGDGRIFYG